MACSGPLDDECIAESCSPSVLVPEYSRITVLAKAHCYESLITDVMHGYRLCVFETIGAYLYGHIVSACVDYTRSLAGVSKINAEH